MNFTRSSNTSTFSLISLGCSKNQVDSEVLLHYLHYNNYQLVDLADNPDIIIINTCGFIQDAKEESIESILEARYHNKDALLIVAGCFSQLYKSQLKKEMPEIDILMGTNEYSNIINIINEYKREKKSLHFSENPVEFHHFHKRELLDKDSLHTYIKIAEGCSRKCSFCIIPKIKGYFRSKPQNLILKEVIDLADKGIFEFNLISQDTMLWGRDLSPNTSIISLITELEKINQEVFFRLLYLNPYNINEDFLYAIKDSKKFINYFDIPIQHLSDKILKLMNRYQDKTSILDKIELIRKILPDAIIRTTVMVGFPEESDDDFMELLEGISDIEFDRLGCFIYSDEELSESYIFQNKISKETAQERFDEIMQRQMDIHQNKMSKHINSIHKAIITDKEKRLLIQAPDIDGQLIIKNQTRVKPGMYNVLIDSIKDYDYIGHIIDEK